MKRPQSSAGEEEEEKNKTAVDIKRGKYEHELAPKLVELIRQKKKLSQKKAKVYITVDDLKSFEKSQSDHEKREWIMPQFFVQDLQRILLFSLIGDQYRFYPRWCRILRPNHIKSVVLISVNNLSEFDYKTKSRRFKKLNKLFLNEKSQLNSIEFVGSNANGKSFLNEFMPVPITHAQWLKIRDEDEFQLKRNEVVQKYQRLFQTKQKTNPSTNNSVTSNITTATTTSELDKIPRTSLMLSISQMAREDYPLPFDKNSLHNMSDYVFSKTTYKHVTNESPLYSIDCEMCYNVDGDMETVWLAIVNERMECVYETFIKPRKKIRNYLTNITGVTAKMLEEVTIDLKQVQEKISEILPDDAILCGQSLNNDLHSLKMFHPYVIDTSVIYNLAGNREIKPSLRRLSAQFLGKLIQESTHNPIVDAKASLQLVLLKLRQGLEFGDVIVNGCTNVYDEEKLNTFNMEDIDLSDPFSISKFVYKTGINIEQNFFHVLRDNKIDSVFIDKNNTNQEATQGTNKRLDKNYLYEDDAKGFELTEQSINNYKFVWSQFHLNESNSEQIESSDLKRLVKFICRLYESLNDDTLFMVAFTGRSSSLINNKEITDKNEATHQNDLFKGRCFLKYKCNQMDDLNKEIQSIYSIVNPKLND